MDLGDLCSGLCALDVVRLSRNPDGSQRGLTADDLPVSVLSGPPYVWDDLRFPAQGINPTGQSAPPTVDTTTFPGTLLFSTSANNLIAGVAQMPHEWAAGTAIHAHLHWAKTSSAAGGVMWEWRYSIADIGGVFPAHSAWIQCTNPVPDSDTLNKHALAAFPLLDMTGRKESVMIAWQIRRNVADAIDIYGANARLFEFDIRFQKSKLGSVAEF